MRRRAFGPHGSRRTALPLLTMRIGRRRNLLNLILRRRFSTVSKDGPRNDCSHDLPFPRHEMPE
jgi:hypothetical protein